MKQKYDFNGSSKNRNFDSKEFSKIIEIYKEGKYIKALKFIRQYMIKYPNDPWVMPLYVNLLILTEQLEEAKYYLENFSINHGRNFKFFLISWFKRDYKKAYEFLLKFIDEYKTSELLSEEVKKNFNIQKLYLEKKLNCLDSEIDFYKMDYKELQIIEYSEKKAIEHIINRHTVVKKNILPYNVFEKEIDVKQLFFQVKELLMDDLLLYNDLVFDIYYFKYPLSINVTEKPGTNYKYLKVITILDTKNIITMYPVFSQNRVLKVNSLEKAEDNLSLKTKTKTLSQIEKFNQKYKIDSKK